MSELTAQELYKWHFLLHLYKTVVAGARPGRNVNLVFICIVFNALVFSSFLKL